MKSVDHGLEKLLSLSQSVALVSPVAYSCGHDAQDSPADVAELQAFFAPWLAAFEDENGHGDKPRLVL